MQLKFEPISLEMQETIKRYTGTWNIRESEYTFTNLYIWGYEDRIKIAQHDDVLYILVECGYTEPFMFAPLPMDVNADYKKAIGVAEDYFSGVGLKPAFSALNDTFKALFETHAPYYKLEEDRDNFDYIYNTADLLYLKGKKYHSKRNHINQFTANNKFECLELRPEMVGECLELYDQWLQNKDETLPGMEGERYAIERLVTHMDELGVKGCSVRVNGKLSAYTLGERINSDMAVIHIEKADSEILGLYTIINQKFVEHFWADTKFINREEDMGIEGMRKAKLSYNPVYLLTKYTAAFK